MVMDQFVVLPKENFIVYSVVLFGCGALLATIIEHTMAEYYRKCKTEYQKEIARIELEKLCLKQADEY